MKHLVVGYKSSGECCACCDECWHVIQTSEGPPPQYRYSDGYDIDIANGAGDAVCGDPTVTEGPCRQWFGSCPLSCCGCFPTGDLCVTIKAWDDRYGYPLGRCSNLDGTEILMSRCAWTHGPIVNQVGGGTLCRSSPTNNQYISCFQEPIPGVSTSIQDGVQIRDGSSNTPAEAHNSYEKWGYYGMICDNGDPLYGGGGFGAGPDPRGEKVKMTLCCCDKASAGGGTVVEKIGPGIPQAGISITKENPADCHSCSYQFLWQWEKFTSPYDSSVPYFCSTRAGNPPGGGWDYDHQNEELVPQCPTQHGGPGPNTDCDIKLLEWVLIEGECPSQCKEDDECVWLMKYRVSGAYYNCNCCSLGPLSTDNHLVMEATITPCFSGCGSPHGVPCHCWRDAGGVSRHYGCVSGDCHHDV